MLKYSGKNAEVTALPAAMDRRRVHAGAGASLMVTGSALTGAGFFHMKTARAQAGGFTLNILHINDMHSRIESVSRFDSTCSASDETEGSCFGGVGRLATKKSGNAGASWKTRAPTSSRSTPATSSWVRSSYTTYKGAAEVEFMKHDRLRRDGDRQPRVRRRPGRARRLHRNGRVPLSISGNTVIAGAERLGGLVDEWAGARGEWREDRHSVGADTGYRETFRRPVPISASTTRSSIFRDAVTRIRSDEGLDKVIPLSHVGFRARPADRCRGWRASRPFIVATSHTLLSNDDDETPAYATMVENPAGKAIPIVPGLCLFEISRRTRAHLRR